jgi:23S rRNA (cytidine2498-2'-O)-methyltransferase
MNKQHLILCRPGFADVLCSELSHFFDLEAKVIGPSAVALSDTKKLPALRQITFARQLLPNAMPISDLLPATAVKEITKRIDVLLKRDNKPQGHFTIHGYSVDDDDALAVARKIAKALRAEIKKSYPALDAKYIDPEQFASEPRQSSDFIIQVFGSQKDTAFFSIATVATGISTQEGGILRMKRFHDAPSRSASKLSEAFLFMGKHPVLGQTGVDLGAAPGGWSMVLAFHGTHVIAIDHSNLDIKDKTHLAGSIRHLRENGLKYLPEKSVDWLVCDMVMSGTQTLEVLRNWIEGHHMKDFVVNIKLPVQDPWPKALEALNFCNEQRKSARWKQLVAKHLYHDRHEITLMAESNPS